MIDMVASARESLAYYLSLEYPFEVLADPEGGYVVAFPDLPGCMTQIEDLAAVGPMAEEIRRLWIMSEYEDGEEIPAPSYPETPSGKFNVRLSRSLHRKLAETAKREDQSLNSYVAGLLGRGDAQARVEQRLAAVEERIGQRLLDIERQLTDIQESLRYRPSGIPTTSPGRKQFQMVAREGYEASVAA